MTWSVIDETGSRIASPMLNANTARLCASAPDLLAVARECLALLTDPNAEPWEADTVTARLERVIARATGGAA